MSMLGFVEEFANIHTTMPNRRFAFILGAGASKSSGIKLASEMVGEWVSILHRRAPDAEGQAVADWASAATLGIAEYDPRDPAASYPALYQRMYGTDPDRGYAYLENQMAQAEPSYGYSVLARIMAEHRHRVVITVNFDNLVADSLSIFSANYPLVCGHESLAPFARTDLRRPLVLKVHRDLLLNPMSTPEQLATMPDGLNEAITALLRQYTPIVLGYGGNDASLMACLEGLARASIPGGVYWCHREGSAEPPERICSFIARQNGHLVPVLGFDELMALLGQKLDLTRPDEIVLKRAEARAEQLKQQLDRITARMTERAAKPRPMAAIAPAPQAAAPVAAPESAGFESVGFESNAPDPHHHPVAADGAAPVSDRDAAPGGSQRLDELDAVAHSLRFAQGKTEPDKAWWQWEREAASEPDPDRRDALYRAALAAVPTSPELLNNYANFLTKIRKDHDAAETHYRRAL
ncbi:MAG TPA: hypothetical protein DDZ76_05555, partial [Xanthomonadales bacterium]|nr:hypothetical protein [Xanthomonadales bacterium]